MNTAARVPRSFVSLGLMLALFACEPLAQTFDGEVLPVETPFRVAPPAPAAPATPPTLTPCPQGWRQTTDPTPRCDPWPESGMATCPVDQAHFPGTPACARIGTACSSGDWASDLPATGRVLYVKAGATGTGTGTQSAPFATLATALAAARSGDIVALSKGSFTSTTRIGAGVTVWGACVAETRVQLDVSSGLQGVIESTSPGVIVKNLRVTGPGVGVAVGLGTADVRVENVVIDRAVGAGVSAQRGARLRLATVAIRDTQPDPQGTFGVGVSVDSGGQLSAQRIVISGAHLFGAFCTEATTALSLQDFAIVHVRAQVSDNRYGYGIAARPNSTLSLVRGIVEDAQSNGLLCDAAQCELVDTVVARTIPAANDPTIGAGLRVSNGTFRASRLWARDNAGFGILMGSKDASLVDTVVSGTRNLDGQSSGIAMVARSVMSAARLEVDGNDVFGILVSNASALTAEDLTVSRTRVGPSKAAVAMSLIGGSSATLTRATFEQNDGQALLAGGPGVTVSATDLIVAHEHLVEGVQGGGVAALAQAKVTLRRAHFEAITTSGLYADGSGTSVGATDIAIANMQVDGKYHQLGTAIVASDRGLLQIDRLQVLGSQVAGVHASSSAVVALTEVFVADTALPDCQAPAPCNGERNIGVLAQDGAALTLKSFLLLNNGGFGVLLDHAAADLSDGEVNGHVVGANVLDPAFDLSRLDQRVAYRHNGRKLDAAVVPLPRLPPVPQQP